MGSSGLGELSTWLGRLSLGTLLALWLTPGSSFYSHLMLRCELNLWF